ncbi:helix-turn-helix domain-containing protein [Mesorhizobium sp. CAU 1741]|uniref:MerR family transcriptional regulator n=1 Tax=Mesorhizobium sp. CAU 1741 TaxID=3140366 RepID=UPI00325AFD16
MLAIGELSRSTGVKVPTIRYYEQMGLISAAGRSEGNQRRYEPSDRDRLAFIKHARDLGFTIDAIRELLDLSANPECPCAQADEIAGRQLQSVQDKIARLTVLEDELRRMTTRPHGDHVRDCYIIRSLADHALCRHEH